MRVTNTAIVGSHATGRIAYRFRLEHEGRTYSVNQPFNPERAWDEVFTHTGEEGRLMVMRAGPMRDLLVSYCQAEAGRLHALARVEALEAKLAAAERELSDIHARQFIECATKQQQQDKG